MLAWQLVSGAGGICQTVGWHQLVPTSDSTTDRNISLFWLTYLLDKGLSLRLGRPCESIITSSLPYASYNTYYYLTFAQKPYHQRLYHLNTL